VSSPETTVTVRHICGHQEEHDLSARPAEERRGFARLMALLPCSDCVERESRTCPRAPRRPRRHRGADAPEGPGWDFLFEPGLGCGPEMGRPGWNAELDVLFVESEALLAFDVSPVYDFDQAFADGLTPPEVLEECRGGRAAPGVEGRLLVAASEGRVTRWR
jgi:hypothetical protein